MEYDKLIRDNIPAIMEAGGKKAVTRILGDEEYMKYLRQKLQEEVQEFLESGETEELCDITEVIAAIVSVKGVTDEEFLRMKEEKAKKNGRFQKRILLVRTQ